MNSKFKAQSLAEVSILLMLTVAFIVGMQVYVKRSIQARYKGSIDVAVDLVTSLAESSLKQYEPYYQDTVSDSTLKYLNTDTAGNEDTHQKIITGQHFQSKSQVSSVKGVDFEQDDGWE
jgi:hypothetical protein